MTWDELSMADLCALYEHATAYTFAATQSKLVNGDVNMLSDKDKAWHKYWRDLKIKCAHTILKRSQQLEDSPSVT